MPISTVWILKYVQQCYVKWFWTISSLGAPDASLIRKYEGKSKNDLKKSLKVLKQSANADITEINTYLAYCVTYYETTRRFKSTLTWWIVIIPSLKISGDMSKGSSTKKMKSSLRFPWMSVLITCRTRTRTLLSVNPTKVFNLPSWIPTLSDPVISFNLEPPTYQQLSNVIRKMKASGSPCPLD